MRLVQAEGNLAWIKDEIEVRAQTVYNKRERTRKKTAFENRDSISSKRKTRLWTSKKHHSPAAR